jgi:hypothetical protein
MPNEEIAESTLKIIKHLRAVNKVQNDIITKFAGHKATCQSVLAYDADARRRNFHCDCGYEESLKKWFNANKDLVNAFPSDS